MRHAIPILLCLALGTSLLGADSALSKAVIAGALPEVKALQEQGKDLNANDKWGWTPLLWAAFYKQEPIARLLLAKGADPNKASTEAFRTFPVGTTPLMVAAYYGSDTLIAEFMAHKADPDQADAEGKDAVAIARGFEFKECVDLLKGRAKPAETSALHSHTHHLLEGRIEPLLVVVSVGGKVSEVFLSDLDRELRTRLEARKMPYKIFVRDALALDEGKALAEAGASLKAKYVLSLDETARTLSNWARSMSGVSSRSGGEPVRLGVTFHAEVKAWGAQTVLWARDVTAEDSAARSPNGIKHDLVPTFVISLFNELEVDDLL